MRALLRRLDPLRVVAILLFGLPLTALVAFGFIWLWQRGWLLHWLLVLAVFAGLGYLLQGWLARRQRRLLEDIATEPAPDWPPDANDAWARIDRLAEGIEPDEWPLDDGDRLLLLGRRALETVARCYHPEEAYPALQITVPHALLIIERASRDLRLDITQHIPFSHRLKLGDVLRVQQWSQSAERAFRVYRAGRLIVNPLDALVSEAWRHVRDRGLGAAGVEMQRWLLRAYVRKVGYYAIDLYSGRLPLDEATHTTATTRASGQAATEARREAAELDAEPVRIVVLGRDNAGKSSLINALFDSPRAIQDASGPGTRGVRAFELAREGFTRALIFDTPAFDSPDFGREDMLALTAEADLVLWVSAVHRPDRAGERDTLAVLEAQFAARSDRHAPPVLVVATHIDRLRPVREWAPPYDLQRAERPKARNIRDAVAALADDLGVGPERVVPVCLAADRVYNVDDVLWARMLAHQSEAERNRLIRCLAERRREENWSLLRRQLASGGRWIAGLGSRRDQRH